MGAPLRVLDAARTVVDEVNRLLDRPNHGFVYEKQLRDSAQSMAANIREALGRREGAERNQFVRFARGSAEETDEHLRANFRRGRLSEPHYWRLHNRLTTIVKMLNGLMEPTPSPTSSVNGISERSQ